MKKEKNVVWEFFASVKLALFTLFVLAAASIIGTVVPQNEAPEKYMHMYGPAVTKFFTALHIIDMYNSWWFQAMLVTFSLNLVVCTIERFPMLWNLMTQDNLETEPSRVSKMAQRRSYFTPLALAEAAAQVGQLLPAAGWPTRQAEKEGGVLLFSQKGAWTRMGVVAVHVSILVIFAGAIVGSIFGFKSSVLIPEGGSADKIYKSDGAHTAIPLGFEMQCKNFSLTYYDTGAPKEFRSDLVVVKDGKELDKKSIVVNDPMKFGGLTFYQSSYQAMDGQYNARLEKVASKASQKFLLVPRQESKWREENVTFGITNVSGPDQMRRFQYKIWFSDGKGGPSEFWLAEGTTATIKRSGGDYTLTVRQRMATGLQVVKDPGVWTVYIGCIMMILGLAVVFFISHRRVWVYIAPEGSGSRIQIGGISNKNKFGFEKDIELLATRFVAQEQLNITKERS